MISTYQLFKKDSSAEIYIIIEIGEHDFNRYGLDQILEGEWKPSRKADFWHRVDAEAPQMNQQRHVHVVHKKHLKAKSKQVSWNQDLSRHDRKSFDQNIKGLETAKQITLQALGLPDDAILEEISKVRKLALLMESSNSRLPFDNIVYLKI